MPTESEPNVAGAIKSLGLSSLQFKTIDGLKIRYATSEAKGGRPILLLGPWPESILAFLPTWDTFATLGPVVAVDLPGFGRSESRPGILAPEAMGDFIPQILRAFGIQEPHVVAPDIGTPAVLYSAVNHPGLFKSMILGGGATDPTDIGGVLDEMVNAPSLEPFKNMTGADFVRGTVENLKTYKLPPEALDDYTKSYEGERFLNSVGFVRQYPEQLPRLAARLSQIKTPCQIVVGRFDPFVPISNAELLLKRLPKSKLDILECGHFAWEDGAAEYGRLASVWINGGHANL